MWKDCSEKKPENRIYIKDIDGVTLFSDDETNSLGMTSYGTLFHLNNPLAENNAKTLTIDYPLVQQTAKVSLIS